MNYVLFFQVYYEILQSYKCSIYFQSQFIYFKILITKIVFIIELFVGWIDIILLNIIFIIYKCIYYV